MESVIPTGAVSELNTNTLSWNICASKARSLPHAKCTSEFRRTPPFPTAPEGRGSRNRDTESARKSGAMAAHAHVGFNSEGARTAEGKTPELGGQAAPSRCKAFPGQQPEAPGCDTQIRTPAIFLVEPFILFLPMLKENSLSTTHGGLDAHLCVGPVGTRPGRILAGEQPGLAVSLLTQPSAGTRTWR